MIQNAAMMETVQELLAVLVEKMRCAMIQDVVKILTVLEQPAVLAEKMRCAMIQNVVKIQTVLMSPTRFAVCALMTSLAADLSAVWMRTVRMVLCARTSCAYLKGNVTHRGHVREPMRSAMFLNMTTAITVMRMRILQNANL